MISMHYHARSMTATSSVSGSCFAGQVVLPRRRMTKMRYLKEDDVQTQLPDTVEQQQNRHPTDTKLTYEQIAEVMWKRGFPYKDGEVSPRMAEMRADLGSAIYRDLNMAQTFDGPAPETVNGRLAMLGVLSGLLGEAFTGQGLLQQTADHPGLVLASFVIISIATYAPIFKGYTRKEPYANGVWTPRAENWNGRLAMLGFAGMLLTELIAGCNTLQAYGLQPHMLGH